MASTLGVDGLASGLDTTSLINSLMSIEKQPQTRLKTALSTDHSRVSALQSVNTKIAALTTAAEAVAKATSWTAAKATSSSDAVVVATGSEATTGSVSFSVSALASAHSLVSGSAVPLNDSTTFSGFPLEVRAADGTTLGSISPSSGSLQDVVGAINKAENLGVKAMAIKVADGSYRLQLTSTSTGAASAFTVSGLTGGGGLDVLNAGTDARVHVGPAAGGYDVTSSTNTLTDLTPGLTVTLRKANADVTVDVVEDRDVAANAVQALVDATNALLTEVGSNSTMGIANADGSRAGVGALAGDSGLRDLAGQLVNRVIDAVGGKSAAAMGLQSTKDGRLSFDRDTFLSALTADPAGTRAVLVGTDGTPGVALRLSSLASSVTTTMTSRISGVNDEIRGLNDRISDWDVRLEARQTALRAQFTAMETALSSLKSQSSWLSQQIASLSGSSSS